MAGASLCCPGLFLGVGIETAKFMTLVTAVLWMSNKNPCKLCDTALFKKMNKDKVSKP